MDFVSVKSKNLLVFFELILEVLVKSSDITPEESPIKGDPFLIASSDPWYGDILVYLQTLKCPKSASRDERHYIHHQAEIYLILCDTLY